MKKLFLAVLLLATLCILCACTGSEIPEESTAVTEAPTEPTTETPTEAPTSAPTEAPTETEAPASGCGSVISATAMLPALVAMGVCVSRKRRKTEE